MPIDGHAHLPLDTPAAEAWLRERGLRVVNICVDTPELGGIDRQRGWYRTLWSRDPRRFAWITSFAVEGFGTDGWAERAVVQLEADFAAGAVGCKVWKNVGMELRDADGSFVFVDDPRFEPIFRYLEDTGRPLLMHIAEPVDCWQALDPRSPHYGYYSTATQWHWHGRSDVPTHERLIASRDAIVARHPRLTVIGAHFGSQEHDLAAVAERLDRWPNYRVDTGARLGNLAIHAAHDRAATRDFLTAYADRIIWGVDWVLTRPASALTCDEWRHLAAALEARYDLERRFLVTDEPLTIGAYDVRGLALGEDVVEQLTVRTARQTYGLP